MLLEAPAKEDKIELQTPAFSTGTSQNMISTKESTYANAKAGQSNDQTFSKLSGAIIEIANVDEVESKINFNDDDDEHKSSSSKSRPEKSLIAGDLNFLLDKEIQKVGHTPKTVRFQGCNSTHHSSTSKSPLEAYADMGAS